MRFYLGCAAMGFLAAFLSVSLGTDSKPQREQLTYCEGVEQGQWPDYQRTYFRICRREV